MRWKAIPGYEGYYEVSDTGKVRNAKTGIELRQYYAPNEYRRVRLYKDSVQKDIMVHRLVASTFIRLPEEGEQVNYIDMNKANNCVDNLEWCTQSYNLHHSWVNGGREKNRKALMRVLCKETAQLDMEGNVIKVWPSMSEAARSLGLSVSNICNCCSGRIRSTGGFKWARCSDY